jgi:hypothetical protein
MSNSLADIEAGHSETTPLLQTAPEASVPGAFPIEKKMGFVIGDFDHNRKYAQQILDESSSRRLIWTRPKHLLKQSAIDFGVAFTNIGGTYGLSKFFLDRNQNGETTNMIKMQAISNAVAQGTGTLAGLAKIVIFPPEGAELAAATMKVAITRARKELKPLLDTLTSNVREGIDATIDEFVTKVENFKIGDPFNPTTEELKKRWKHILDIVSLPFLKPNTYQHDLSGDPLKGAEIDAAQTKITTSFSDEVRDGLDDVMTTHRFGSIDPSGKQPFHIFDGPAAVGKTWSVRKMGTALDAKVIVATADDLADFLSVQLKDRNEQRETFDYDLWKWIKPEGKVWQELRTAAPDGNVILFLDEISLAKHPELLDPIKRWMTGEDPIFPNSRNIPGCPKFTVIMASNEDIYAQLDRAAKSRVTSRIKFPNWTPELIVKRAQEYVGDKRQNASDLFRGDSVEKTYKDVASLLVPMLAIVNRYPPGTLTLRDVQTQIDKVCFRLQTSNDIRREYDLANLEERMERDLEQTLEINRVDIISKPKGVVLGGAKPPADRHPGKLFLEAYDRRTAQESIKPAEQRLELLNS